MKILIVEDEPTSRKLLEIYLTGLGECFLAKNGSEAIDCFTQSLVEEHPFDLVCMDIAMPGINGVEAVERIREIEANHSIAEGSGSKIIMVTTHDYSDEKAQAFLAGCEGYLVKPVSKQDLYDALEKVGLGGILNSRV